MFFILIFQPLGTWWATQTIFVTRHLLKLLLYFLPIPRFIHIHWGVVLCIYACIDMYVCVYFPHCIILFNLIHFLIRILWYLIVTLFFSLLYFPFSFVYSFIFCIVYFGTINNAIQLLVLFSFFHPYPFQFISHMVILSECFGLVL